MRLKWDQLPQHWQDLHAFLPRIVTIMESKFLPSDGFKHEIVGQAEYRVRRGFIHGLDVRVWRQGEDLILNVSPGSRLSSLLPGVAAVAALIGAATLEHVAESFGFRLPYGLLPKRSSQVLFAVGMVLFLIFWGGLALVMRPFVGRLEKGCDERSILSEIVRGFSVAE